jgi:hypothetical protein
VKTAATGAEFGRRLDEMGNTNQTDNGDVLPPDPWALGNEPDPTFQPAEVMQPHFSRNILNYSGIGRLDGGRLSEVKLSAVRDALRRYNLEAL